MKLYTWDTIKRFENDPCGCKLCKKIQKAVESRNSASKLKAWYMLQEDVNGQKALAEIRIA